MSTVNANADLSSASSASNQSANNQNFAGLFGNRNLSRNDYTKPALIVGGIFIAYLILKKKKLV